MKRRTFLGAACASATTVFIGACATTGPRPPQRVGYLSGNAATPRPHPAFFKRLHELRAIDDRDIVSGGVSSDLDELRALTSRLVASPVDVILAAGGLPQLAAADTTRDVPIVLVAGPDPVSRHLVRSNAHPDRNITGVARNFDADALKMIQLLKDAVPNTARVAFIYRSDNTAEQSVRAAKDYGSQRGIAVTALGARDLAGIDAALSTIASHDFDGIITTSILSITLGDVARVPRFAIAHGIPQMFGDVELMEAGGLMYFSPDYPAMHRHAADYVDKILRGTRPQDLPIDLIERSVFGINLETLTALHLAIPPAVLAQASRVYP